MPQCQLCKVTPAPSTPGVSCGGVSPAADPADTADNSSLDNSGHSLSPPPPLLQAPSHHVCLSCAKTCAAAAIAQGASVLPCFAEDDCKASYLASARLRFTTPAARTQLENNARTALSSVSGPSALRKLEEDLTKATMRKCPGCRKPFIRIEGCTEVGARRHHSTGLFIIPATDQYTISIQMHCSSCGVRFCCKLPRAPLCSVPAATRKADCMHFPFSADLCAAAPKPRNHFQSGECKSGLSSDACRRWR